MPNPGYLSYPTSISPPNSTTALSCSYMQYSTTTITLQDSVFKDQQIGSLGGPVSNDPTWEIQWMEQYMGCPDYMQYYYASTSATAGMLLDQNMNMDCVMNTPVSAQFYPTVHELQPQMGRYIQMQYPMNVADLARRIGQMPETRSSSGGSNKP